MGMDFEDICKRVQLNGEPGFFWLGNAQQFGRMADPPVLGLVKYLFLIFLCWRSYCIFLWIFFPLP
jgi:hypothetical protein